MMDMMMGSSMGGSMGSSGSAMAGMGSDAMGMMMNKMDMMMSKVDMMMSPVMNSGMAPTAYGQGMGYMQAPGYAGQAYGYMQTPVGSGAFAAQGGGAAHGAATAAHGATTGILGTPGVLNMTSLLTGLLNLAIAIFAILLIIGLVVGSFIFLKKLLLGDSGVVAAAKPVGNTCVHCGNGLTQSFNFCPACGEKKISAIPVINTAPVTV